MKKHATSFCANTHIQSTSEQTTKLTRNRKAKLIAFTLIYVAVISLVLPVGNNILPNGAIVPTVNANGTYHNFTGGNLNLNITPTTTNLITSNDDWSGFTGIEGYCGTGLTGTHGVDPQTVLTSEYATLPSAGHTCVNANKGNPSAFNTGGVTEFDRGDYLAIGFQGNVQANPYLVFYLNTTGQDFVGISFDVTDIDVGSNNSVSPVALQYRIGETGNFTNVPAGYVADATEGPSLAGKKTSRNVVLPLDANNQPKLQVRLISTNAAGPGGSSTPDEWIGINNIILTNDETTGAGVRIGGRVTTPVGRPVYRALVTMYDSTGNSRTATTNPFGFYYFEDVEVGETYIFALSAKNCRFSQSTQMFYAIENYDSLNFVADQ